MFFLSLYNTQEIKSVIFYSQQAVETFLLQVEDLMDLTFFCLSQRIAKPLIEKGCNVFYPEIPVEKDLLALIKAHQTSNEELLESS